MLWCFGYHQNLILFLLILCLVGLFGFFSIIAWMTVSFLLFLWGFLMLSWGTLQSFVRNFSFSLLSSSENNFFSSHQSHWTEIHFSYATNYNTDFILILQSSSAWLWFQLVLFWICQAWHAFQLFLFFASWHWWS